jgi:hypothetical protein
MDTNDLYAPLLSFLVVAIELNPQGGWTREVPLLERSYGHEPWWDQVDGHLFTMNR